MYVVKIKRSKFYQIIYFVNGKRTTVSTKTTNLNSARKYLKDFNPDNRFINPPKEINILLSKYCEEYVEFLKQSKSKNYVRCVELSFKMLITYANDVLIKNLQLQTIEKFLTHTFSRTQQGAVMYYRTLKAAFSKAVLWEYIQDNPFKKIKAPKASKSFPVFISEIELQLILDKTPELLLKNIFLIAFYTGMRLSEIVNMKWSWIDLSKEQITVRCSEDFITKGKRERIIPLNTITKAVLRSILPKIIEINKDDYVFTRIKEIKLNDDFVSKKFKTAVRAAKLDERIHFHTLRHSFASLLVQKGVSLYVIKELLGHEALITTQIYSHLQHQNLREAMNRL